MRKLLRQTTSGHLYVWTEQLAQRPDMEEYIHEEVKPVQEQQEAEGRLSEQDAQKIAQRLFKRKRNGGFQEEVGASDNLAIKID